MGTHGNYAPIAASGALAGLALFARSSTLIYVPILALYVCFVFLRSPHRIRRALGALGALIAGFTPVLSLYLFSNWWKFGSPLDAGAAHPEYLFVLPLWEGLSGLLLSPGKSVFLYAPPVLVGLAAVPFAFRARWKETLLLVGTVIADLVVYGT